MQCAFIYFQKRSALFALIRYSERVIILFPETRASERVSRADSKKYNVTANYSPQILKVHMYTDKKLALQVNIFKISNVE